MVFFEIKAGPSTNVQLNDSNSNDHTNDFSIDDNESDLLYQGTDDMEFMDLSASDMSIGNTNSNNEDAPNELNFSVESSFVDDAESLNIPVSKKIHLD